MKKLANFLIGAVALCAVTPSLARAGTLLVTVTAPSIGVDVTWEQSTNPTPIAATNGNNTDVAVSNFHSTGATSVGPYPDVIWFNISQGGGFTLGTAAFLAYSIAGPQAYTGSESAPVFAPGSYSGTEFFSGAAATYTLAAVGAPGPIPGTGAAALAALALAGLYARARRA